MQTTLIIVILVTTNYYGGDTCMFTKPPKNIKQQNLWDTMKFKRSETSCECGMADPSTPDWNVNIETKNAAKSCTGTIVASDLIVTSHKCLELSGQRMRLYDLLQFKHGQKHLSEKEEITVTNPKDASKIFKVRKVFYNPQYALSSEKKIYPYNDVVILQVEADFIKEPGFNPICLPFYDKNLDDEEIHDQPGKYYGPPVNASGGVGLFHGDILKKAACYEENDVQKDKELTASSANTTLCLRHQDHNHEPPKQEGGPLIVIVPSKQTFLVGIAHDVSGPQTSEARGGLVGSMGEYYTFFSGINPVIKFIEFYADKEKSRWCKTPLVKVLKTRKTSRTEGRTMPKREKPWPWDLKNNNFNRNESLDCTCGIQNTNIGGRVVGGVEATPREFGWMAVVHLHMNGRGHGASLCGGAIINDRMIITAAHCVVSDKKLARDPKKDPSINPKDVTVTLNAHLQNNDPEGIEKEVLAVLFHPDYLDSRTASPEYYDSDVALLILKDKLNFASNNNRGLRPICLPKSGEYMQILGKTVWVVGWGLTDPKDHSSTAQKLQKLDIPVIETKQCRDVAVTRVTDLNICAGSLNMYKDAASGDSGGPLQLEDRENSQWYEVGLVSWGEDNEINGKTQTAALYADVQKLMPFIDYHAQRIRVNWCKSTKN